MNLLQKLFIAGALAVGFAFAQVDEASLANMKWPPPYQVNWLGSKIFNYVGDYGYYQDHTPMTSFWGTGTDWQKWRFVYFTGLGGKRVVAWADWGYPSIGPPVRDQFGSVRGDNCGHTHVTQAVWLQYGYYSAGRYYSGYVGPWGASKAGTRINDYSCQHLTTTAEGWGNPYFTMNFPAGGGIWQGMVLGAMGNSHANGFGCGSFECVNQPWMGAYTASY